jgi:sugar O-acyltransferase (sialic acid O-acetyltransferase NeuD family)
MKLALFGKGGHAREVAVQIGEPVTYFVDDNFVDEKSNPLSLFDPEKYLMMVAVSDVNDRKRIISKLPQQTKYFTFIHPTALIMDENVEIGVGSFIGAYSVITTNVKIGQHSILNRGNQIGHDTVIGDFFSAMPGAIISGNVTIGEQVYMGTNSSIKEKLHISSNVTIGSNAAVVKNIITSGVYVGVPVKFKKK